MGIGVRVWVRVKVRVRVGFGLQPACEGVAAAARAVAMPIEGPHLQLTWGDN